MATEKQIQANRLNAERSTGPVTPEGKATVGRNAITHGLRANKFEVLPNEDQAEYQDRLNAWILHYNPTTPVEEELVLRAVNITWKLDRADRFENAQLSRMMADAEDAIMDASKEELDESDNLASFDESNKGERLRRYQLSLHRELIRTVTTLAKFQDQKSKVARAKESNAGIGLKNGASKPNSQVGASKPNSSGAASNVQENSPPPAPATSNTPNKANPTPSGTSNQPQGMPSGKAASSLPSAKIPQTTGTKPAIPNKAEFVRYFQGNADSWGPKSLDLLQELRPKDLGLTPTHRISCEPRQPNSFVQNQ